MSLCLRNHSSPGPQWGYQGGGPSQLAIVILLAVTDTDEAERYYSLFQTGVLALIRADRWTLPLHQVRRWLAHIREKDHQTFDVVGELDGAGVLAVRIMGLDPDPSP